MAWALLIVASGTKCLASHPFHVCIGQMEWNANEEYWELSLRVHPQDLEQAMSRTRGQSTSIDDEDFSSVATAFFENEFFLVQLPDRMQQREVVDLLSRPRKASSDTEPNPTDVIEDRSKLNWVGMEAERGWVWLHFEMKPPTAPASGKKTWLVHRVLLDEVDRQENSVRIIEGTKSYSLQTKKGEPVRPLKAEDS